MIKILIFIVVVFAVIWFIRGAGASRRRADKPAPPVQPKVPQDMVECPVCRVHLPRADALPGPGGQLYCCAEHQRQAAG